MTDLYQSQRAMRRMRKQAMDRGVIAILDVAVPRSVALCCDLTGPTGFRAATALDHWRGKARSG